MGPSGSGVEESNRRRGDAAEGHDRARGDVTDLRLQVGRSRVREHLVQVVFAHAGRGELERPGEGLEEKEAGGDEGRKAAVASLGPKAKERQKLLAEVVFFRAWGADRPEAAS